MRRLRSRRREDCFWVFQKSHWVGLLLWAGLALDFAAQNLLY
jgi:4-hydroxybenzoate polyprenyltransferase